MYHRIDVEIDNSSILRPKYDRFDDEVRSIDVIDEISTKDFSLGFALSVRTPRDLKDCSFGTRPHLRRGRQPSSGQRGQLQESEAVGSLQPLEKQREQLGARARDAVEKQSVVAETARGRGQPQLRQRPDQEHRKQREWFRFQRQVTLTWKRLRETVKL